MPKCLPVALEGFFAVTAVAAAEDVAAEPAESAARERRTCKGCPIVISMEMRFRCTSETRHLIETRDTPGAEICSFFWFISVMNFVFHDCFFFHLYIPFSFTSSLSGYHLLVVYLGCL